MSVASLTATSASVPSSCICFAVYPRGFFEIGGHEGQDIRQKESKRDGRGGAKNKR